MSLISVQLPDGTVSDLVHWDGNASGRLRRVLNTQLA